MKANEKQAKKSLSVKELETELRQTQEKRFKMQFKHQVTPLSNPVELRAMRRQIARLKTWINEKQESK